jgi:3-oxoacyl-[acyl-carrier protein] reductase
MTEPPVIAITGTSRGIGLGMARHFVGLEYRVAGCSRGPTIFTAAHYLHSEVDVTDEKQVRGWIRTIKNHYDHIDIFVCNSAIVPAASLLTATSFDIADSTFRTNVMGAYLTCREAAKVMMLQRSGRIITLSSMAVGLHELGTSVYAASKSAVVEMTKILAKELAPLGITCNVIAPSVFKTSAVENLGEAVVKHALESLTIKREVTIEEICNVVNFFAAPESSSITGQVLYMGLVN